jgi:hypothetical protein
MTAADRTGSGPVIDVRAIGTAAVVGLVLIVPVTIVRAALDRNLSDFDDSAWKGVLFTALLLSFLVAGTAGGRLAPRAPLSNGALGALGAVVLWLPIRLVIWLLRDDSQGLVRGDDAAFGPGQLLVAAVLAVALGMVGGILGARGRDA